MIRSTAIALLISLLTMYCTSSVAEPAKLGVVLPLSGEYAFIGSGIRDGIDLALAEDPTFSKELTLIYEDDQGLNRRATVTAVKKLIDVDRVNMLAVTAVNTVTSVAKLVNGAKLPTLVVWDSNEHINAFGDYIYGYGFANEAAGADIAEFASKRLGVTRFAVVSAQDEWSEIVSKSFTERFNALGGAKILEKQVAVGEMDFRTIVAEIKRRDPEAIYVPLLSGSLQSFLKQLKQSGYKGKILTGDGFSDADIKALGGAAEGIFVMQMWYADPMFQQKFEKKFGRASDGVNLCFAALGYDLLNYVKVVLRASRGSDSKLSSDGIISAINSVSYRGILGEVNFKRSRLSDRRETVLVVKNGTLVPAVVAP